ncbi:hypothetical protein V511_09285 [Mesotoga sp. Brook.08.YT.4.2.5.1]|nr:hypothetical protein V511_09285 [Mesotoga sp. Brook.08.YT.4.2.5.1]PNS42717.1 hypothetical protein RJ60_00355 [Mesotoga sp. B105.6.4]RAO95542.1 hypothetical protein M388_06725 [Mesotoga sp. Brook.08.YT.4.2.5.4.]
MKADRYQGRNVSTYILNGIISIIDRLFGGLEKLKRLQAGKQPFITRIFLKASERLMPYSIIFP